MYIANIHTIQQTVINFSNNVIQLIHNTELLTFKIDYETNYWLNTLFAISNLMLHGYLAGFVYVWRPSCRIYQIFDEMLRH